MKVFVSGRISDLENIRNVQAALRNAGHDITHDWTMNETGAKMLGSKDEKLQNQQEAAHRAYLDIKGVVDCDAYVICTDNIDSGKGMYVELGAALALRETTGKPYVFLVGGMNHLSVFYFHPQVIHLQNVQDVIAYLDKGTPLKSTKYNA